MLKAKSSCRRVVEPVEAAHLVRAVVGAVARADAAVVDLLVEALGAVHRGQHRADGLAGRVLAVLAHHRLVHAARGVAVARRSSGRCASSASRGSCAPRRRRRPGRCSRPGRRRRTRSSRCRRRGRSPCPRRARRCSAFAPEVGERLVFVACVLACPCPCSCSRCGGQRRLLDDGAALHREVGLGGGQAGAAAGLRDGDRAGEAAQAFGGAGEGEGVAADAVGGLAGGPAAVAEGDGDRARVLAGLDEDGELQLAGLGRQRYDVAGLHAQRGGGRGCDRRRVAPRQPA